MVTTSMKDITKQSNKTIRHLYSMRQEQKKTKTPAHLVIKEIMNRMYGKTSLKPNETETVVKTEVIGIRSRKLKQLLMISIVHCGVEIVSTPKRIMNQVMASAEDEGLSIWYQDTGSMHIDYEEVEILAAVFKNKYNRDLIGEDMLQLHIDFDLDGACGDIYSTESYFRAKRGLY